MYLGVKVKGGLEGSGGFCGTYFWEVVISADGILLLVGGYSCNESFTFYPSVPDLLLSLNALPQPPILAIASRSSAPRVATTLLKKLQLHPPSPSSPASSLSADAPASAHGSIHAPAASATKQSTHPSPRSAYEFFDHVQIFPGDKKGHFTKIRDASGVKYEDMVFFDDEARNRNVEALGVVMLLVENGVSAVEVDEGVREWRRRKGKLRNGKSGASVWGKEEGGEDE